MISTDNTTVVSDINKQGGTHSSNLCVEVWKILQWCLKLHIVVRIRHIPGRFNVLADRLSRMNSYQNRVGIGSIDSKFNFPNVQLSQCGSVCDTFQSQTSNLCIPSSGQSSICDRRILHVLKQSTCLRISSNNIDSFRPEQNTSVSVQNSSYSSSLAPTTMVLRGTTTNSFSSSSPFTFSETTNTGKRKVSTSKYPSTRLACLGVIK